MTTGTELHCGYTVTDPDGIEEPCGRPATGWRWYQDVEHEDLLDVVCDWHANEGGRRIHQAEAEVARLRDTMRRSPQMSRVWQAEEEAERLQEGIAALVEAWGCESPADACHPLCCKTGQLRGLLRQGE